MDQIDMEINGMLKKIKEEREYVEIGYEDIDKINRFFEEQSDKRIVPLRKAVNWEIHVVGVEIRPSGGFTIFTEAEQIYGSFNDNCSIKLESMLAELPYGTAYHNRDLTGRYLYIYPEKLRLIVRLEGRIFKHYEFEVENSEK